MKPNYMLIGAGKCATSTICNLLGQHPDVFMVDCKEPFFFSHDEVYARGFEWYESLYKEAGSKKMRGEGSNTYAAQEAYPNTISRITSDLDTDDLKLIYAVRHPIARIESLWIQKRSHGGDEVHHDFNIALQLKKNIVYGSNYWNQINSYRSHFSDKQIHIIFYEDFVKNPAIVMRECFEFLDVEPNVNSIDYDLYLNPSKGKKVERPVISQLRSFPLWKVGANLVPEILRNSIKQRAFFKSCQGRPSWNPDTYRWVLQILEKDTQEFLEFYGKPRDFWSF